MQGSAPRKADRIQKAADRITAIGALVFLVMLLGLSLPAVEITAKYLLVMGCLAVINTAGYAVQFHIRTSMARQTGLIPIYLVVWPVASILCMGVAALHGRS